jgi:hypothetical protein
VKATKHYAALGDIAHGLAVRRHVGGDEADERMLWLVGRDPALVRGFADAAANWGRSQNYVAAMNVATARALANQRFGTEMLAGIARHRSILGVNYVDLLDTQSVKPGDVAAVVFFGGVQLGDRSMAYDYKNSWDEAYDCKDTGQVCSWQWNGGGYDAVFCQECKYKKVNAHLSVKIGLSAAAPDFVTGKSTVTVVGRVVNARKVSPTEAAWTFADAQVIDDRFAGSLLAPKN